jgi:hypothetical protein
VDARKSQPGSAVKSNLLESSKGCVRGNCGRLNEMSSQATSLLHRVLIVEDEENARKGYEALLRKWDCDVLGVATRAWRNSGIFSRRSCSRMSNCRE